MSYRHREMGRASRCFQMETGQNRFLQITNLFIYLAFDILYPEPMKCVEM